MLQLSLRSPSVFPEEVEIDFLIFSEDSFFFFFLNIATYLFILGRAGFALWHAGSSVRRLSCLEPMPSALESALPTTGPPGKSPTFYFFKNLFFMIFFFF